MQRDFKALNRALRQSGSRRSADGAAKVVALFGPEAPDPADVQAYVDGCLSPERRCRVEASLACSPELRGQVAAYRAINIDLHALFDQPLPPAHAALADLAKELERRISSKAGGRRRPDRGGEQGDP